MQPTTQKEIPVNDVIKDAIVWPTDGNGAHPGIYAWIRNNHDARFPENRALKGAIREMLSNNDGCELLVVPNEMLKLKFPDDLNLRQRQDIIFRFLVAFFGEIWGTNGASQTQALTIGLGQELPRYSNVLLSFPNGINFDDDNAVPRLLICSEVTSIGMVLDIEKRSHDQTIQFLINQGREVLDTASTNQANRYN